MGLDMYLRAKRFVSTWKPEELEIAKNVKAAFGFGVEEYEFNEFVLEVMYWRKANAIHRWFVANIQNGQDDCGDYFVEREDLRKLADLCQRAVATKDAALLPPQTGFFFGSTNVDEWYWQDLTRTHQELSKILSDSRLQDGFHFYYHSSW
jgi:hypothetical protein